MRSTHVIAPCTIFRFVRVYDKNLSRCKSEGISVRPLLSIMINIFTISQNLLESRDFTILLRSNGNQPLKPGFHKIVTGSFNQGIKQVLIYC